MVSGFLSCFELKLALAELRRATGSLEAVLLSLFHSRVTSQVTCFFQNRSEISICMKQSSCDTMTDGACLSCISASANIYQNVKFILGFCRCQRLTNDNLQSLQS